MIQFNTPFFNADGKTVSREWMQFFSTLDRALGGNTTIVVNPTSIQDIELSENIDDSVDESSRIPAMIEQLNSLDRMEWISDDQPLGFSTTQSAQSSNVLIWLDI